MLYSKENKKSQKNKIIILLFLSIIIISISNVNSQSSQNCEQYGEVSNVGISKLYYCKGDIFAAVVDCPPNIPPDSYATYYCPGTPELTLDGIQLCNKDGRCALPRLDVKCSDSDGGKDYKNTGKVILTVNGNSKTESDECLSGGSLSEVFCESNSLMVESVICSKKLGMGWGCLDGRCVKGVASVCNARGGTCKLLCNLVEENASIVFSDCPLTSPICCIPSEKNKKVCENCDKFALSYVLGSIFGEDSQFNFVKDNICREGSVKGTLGIIKMSPTTCPLSFFKLALIPISFIFTLLFSLDFLQRFNSLKGKNKGFYRLLVAIILGIIIAYFSFLSYFWGLITLITYVIIKKIL